MGKHKLFLVDGESLARLVRIDIATKSIRMMPANMAWFAADLQTPSEALFALSLNAPGEAPGIVKWSPVGRSERTELEALSPDFSACKVSPSEDRVLLSHTPSQRRAVVCADLAARSAIPLHARGGYADWITDDKILYCEDEASLATFRLSDETTTTIYRVGGHIRPPENAGVPSFTMSPVQSSDRSWIAWSWTARRENVPLSIGAVLIDRMRARHKRIAWSRFFAWLDRSR